MYVNNIIKAYQDTRLSLPLCLPALLDSLAESFEESVFVVACPPHPTPPEIL